MHQRSNRYRAELEVAPVDGAWKLVDIEILEAVHDLVEIGELVFSEEEDVGSAGT